MVTTALGHAKGKAEAPAEMMLELTAIFNITTLAESAFPWSATVATVMPAITSRVPNMTKTMNKMDNSKASKHFRQRNVAASLYDPRLQAIKTKKK